MAPRPDRLGRTLFGYRPEHVRQFLMERDGLITQAERRISEAEAREAETRAEVAALTDRLAASAREIAALKETARAAPEPVEEDPTSATLGYLREEAHRIMTTTQEAAVRIIDRTTHGIDRHIERYLRLKADVETEMEQLSSWREAAGRVRELMEETRVHIRDVPGRLREALLPLDGAVISLDDKLAGLAEMAGIRDGRTGDTTAGDANGQLDGEEAVITLEDEGEISVVAFGPPPPIPTEPSPRFQ